MRYYLNAEYVKECLRYEDGKLYWKPRPREHFNSDKAYSSWNTRYSWLEAGYVNYQISNGHKFYYHYVYIDYKRYKRADIIWLLFNGKWPTILIDHKNRNTLDDSIDNLREASRSQNTMNSTLRCDNKYGRGINLDLKTGKFRVRIQINSERIVIGEFDYIEEAIEARKKAEQLYFGDFIPK